MFEKENYCCCNSRRWWYEFFVFLTPLVLWECSDVPRWTHINLALSQTTTNLNNISKNNKTYIYYISTFIQSFIFFFWPMKNANSNLAVYPSYFPSCSDEGIWWLTSLTRSERERERKKKHNYQNEDTKGFPFNRPGMLTAPRVTTHPFHDRLNSFFNSTSTTTHCSPMIHTAIFCHFAGNLRPITWREKLLYWGDTTTTPPFCLLCRHSFYLF